MAPKQLKNFVQHVLTVAALSTDVTLTWDSVSGWPTVGDFFLRLDNPALTISELYRVTSVNVGANQTTGVRAQEGTGASAFAINSTGGNDLTAQTLTDGFVRLDTALSQDLTGPLRVPGTLGGPYATTGYGSMPILVDHQLPAAAASVLIPASGVLPTGGRNLKIKWKLKTSTATPNEQLNLRFNGNITASYVFEYISTSNAASTGAETNSAPATLIIAGTVPGTTAPANSWGAGEITIFDYNSATDHKLVIFSSIMRQSAVAGGLQTLTGGGLWIIAPVAITTVTLSATGNVTGIVDTYMEP